MPDPAMAISLKAAAASAPCHRSAALCPQVIDHLLTTMPCAQRICATLIHPQHKYFHRSQPHNRQFPSARVPAGPLLASSDPRIQAPFPSTRRLRAQPPRAITSDDASPPISLTPRRPNARACWPVVSPPPSAFTATPASSIMPRGLGRAQHCRPHFGSSPSRLFHGLGGACTPQFSVSPRTSSSNPCAWRAVAVRTSGDLRVTPGAATARANVLASSGGAAAAAAATATAATNGAVAPPAASRHNSASADASVREKVLDGEGREYPYSQQPQLQEPRFHRRTGGEAFVALESSPMVEEAWELLQASTVYYCNQPVGTVAASDPTDASPLNYDQVFIRDFIPSAVAFLLSGQPEIVRNFLLYTLQLQSWEKTVDCHRPGEGLMPASFKVTQVPMDNGAFEEHLDPDFGESAIGRVAPVDSGLWWIQLLRAYGKCTGDMSLQQRLDVQTGMKLILKICLADHFDMFPTLITTDGSCMIDRRLGIHGHPLEIQSLLYGALRAAREMLSPENGGADLLRAVDARLTAMSFHVRRYYWLDLPKLNEIYRYKTEEYSSEAVNKFNIYPDQIPTWLMDWIPDRGGYLVGNVQPAHMDFRFFCLGNMWAVVSSLAAPAQAEAVLDLVEEQWDDLVGAMPLKIVFPALEGEEWRIITGSDPKNTPWSYHNGGSWPVLLWQFTAACIKMGRPHLAERAVALVEKRLQKDRWPEYYDTRSGRFIGKQARLHQTWSIAGYLASKLLLANPDAVWLFATEEDQGILDAASSFLGTGQRRRRTYPLASPLP